MRKSNTLASVALAGAIVLGVSAAANTAQAGDDMEKCYGVVKAGKNDCGNASGSHSCAGHATEDGAGGEWLFVPKGTCERLVGGHTEPAKDDSHDH